MAQQEQKIAANATPIPFAANAEYATFLVYGAKFEVEKKYRLVKPIGHGAYGVVCSAINLGNGQKIAIKKISKAFHNTNQTKRTLREIRILRHFNHPNILRLYDLSKPRSWEEFDDIYMVTELLDTDLHQIINSGQQLTDDHMQYFMYQILKGVKYIHSAHVIHRDLKPSNVLVNANCELKICDFGLARVARPEENNPGFLTEYVATRWYRAPEIMLSWKEYTQAVDMWAVGCIFAELLGRKPLFPGRDYMHQLHLVIETLGTPSAEDTEYIANEKAKNYVRSLPFQPKISFQKLFPTANPVALDLLEKMLAFAPEKRITVQQALEHPYLAALHDPAEETVAPELFNFDFELQAQSKEAIKALIWNDIAAIHPELPRIAVPAAPPPAQAPFSPVAPADMDMN